MNHPIYIASKRRKPENILKEIPNALIIDVTSKAELPFVKFSPFYPIGGIPIPNSKAIAASVEGIWQGLKVFENHGVDSKKFENTTMKGLKRTVRKFGKPKGHQFGTDSNELLSYIEARKKIYLPVYHWVLENKLQPELALLQEKLKDQPIVLLDYETNENVEDRSKPLSHASLIKNWLINS